jgi:hypothetical protein
MRLYTSFVLEVAVGMPVTQHPPHRSRRAARPHRAPALGRTAQTLRGIRVADTRCGEPEVCEGVHPLPGQPVPLTPSAERPTPGASDRLATHRKQTAIARHPVITVVPKQHTSQPSSLLWDGPVHTLPQGGFDLLQFLAQPLGNRLPPHRKLALPRLTAYMREAEEVKSLRLALTTPLSPVGRIASTLDQSRLLRV